MEKIENNENTLAIFDKKISDVKDLNCEFEIKENSVATIKHQTKVNNTFENNAILTGDGKIKINTKALPTLMNTTSKIVKIKIYNSIEDEHKFIIDNQLYIDSQGVTPLLIETRDNANTKLKEEICQQTLNNLNIVENSPIVGNQRAIARELINKLDEDNKKEALKNISECALTGEKLKEPVVHHDKCKAGHPAKVFLNKDNYKVLEAKNHILGHCRDILDDPNTNWEEKKEEFKKLNEK